MHCLLTALGSYGDVHPMVGLGAALAQRGHEVEIVSNPHFEQEITGAGLRFTPVSTVEKYDELTQHADLWRPRGGMQVVFEHGVAGLLRELYAVIDGAYRPGETLIAAHGLDHASRLLAESRGAPVTSVVYAPMALWSDRAPPRLPLGFNHPRLPRWLVRAQFRLGERLMLRRVILPTLDPFREELGLPRLLEKFGGYWPWYYGVAPPLCLFPDWFAIDPGDWPAGTETTGFPLWDGGAVRRLSDEDAALLSDGQSPIVFTPGSANRAARAFFDAAVDACGRLNRRGVLLTKYPEQLPSRLPETVRWLGFAPLGEVLHHAVAFVHHGGIGSSARGLAAGVPQVIQPYGFDQYDNATRLKRLGVAEELVPKRFRGPALAETLDRLLGSNETRRRAEQLSTRCNAEEALNAACDALEQRFEAATQ